MAGTAVDTGAVSPTLIDFLAAVPPDVFAVDDPLSTLAAGSFTAAAADISTNASLTFYLFLLALLLTLKFWFGGTKSHY